MQTCGETRMARAGETGIWEVHSVPENADSPKGLFRTVVRPVTAGADPFWDGAEGTMHQKQITRCARHS